MHSGEAGKLKEAVGALYAHTPTAEELQGTGFEPSDYETDPVEVWPENQPAVSLFQFLSSQWRVGMSGPTGLDYNVAYRKMDRMGLTPAAYDDLESDLQVLEYEALATINQKK